MSSGSDELQGGGSSGLSALVDRYVSVDGLQSLSTRPDIDVNLFGMLQAIFIGAVFAFFAGVADLVSAILGGVALLFQTIGETFGRYVGLLGGFEGAIEASVFGARITLSQSGLLAFALGVAVVAVTAYIISLGVAQLD